MLSHFLRQSIIAFNGSKNANKNSPEEFYNSYIERKKQIIDNKKLSYYKGAKVDWDKHNSEVYLFNEATQKKQEVKDFMAYFLSNDL